MSTEGWDVLRQAAALERDGQEFAVATVVWRQGPSSGQQGGRAVITADGELRGWIGGACAEPTVIREAQRAIADGHSRLLLLGTPEQFGAAAPEGMTVIPIACQSEGALEVFIEPVLPTPHLVIVGRSPMAETLRDLAGVLGWPVDLHERGHFDVPDGALVVVATQGHGDEEALERALAGRPAYVGFVASERRGDAVRGYLADRGVAPDLLDLVRAPAGLDLGHTSHKEIAVAILAELVALRASGTLAAPGARAQLPAEVIDPVCGMTVTADPANYPFEHGGTTYYFCCPGCRRAFEKDPAAYLQEERC